MNNHRHPAFACVRAAIDQLDAAVAKAQSAWPERYPVPEDVDALIVYRDTALQLARNGSMRGFAEAIQG